MIVRRFYDVPGPTLGESLVIGEVADADELHELLRERTGTFTVTGVATVRLDLEAPIIGDRAFVDQIVAGAEGRGPDELVSY